MRFVTPYAKSFRDEDGNLHRISKDLEFEVVDEADAPVDCYSRVMSRETYDKFYAPPKGAKKAKKAKEE